MLQALVLELGNICRETSTKDQCEKHSLLNMRSQLPESDKEERMDFHKPGPHEIT